MQKKSATKRADYSTVSTHTHTKKQQLATQFFPLTENYKKQQQPSNSPLDFIQSRVQKHATNKQKPMRNQSYQLHHSPPSEATPISLSAKETPHPVWTCG